MVQWLRPHAPNAGDTGLIPGWGTKILHTTQHGQKKNKRRRQTKGQSDVKCWEKHLTHHLFLYNKGVRAKYCWQLQEARKGKAMDSPQSFQKEQQPCCLFHFSFLFHFSENCVRFPTFIIVKIINVHCFKATRLVVVCYTSRRKLT